MERTFRVYGKDGHRQAMSFYKNSNDLKFNWEDSSCTILCQDVTGTNDYCEVIINAESAEKCESVLDGQLYDGFFESARFGKITELVDGKEVLFLAEL